MNKHEHHHGHDHEHEHHSHSECDCGCGHDHAHDHDHEHEHHSHGECGCGCEHDHEHEHHSHGECGRGCEHDHEHEHHSHDECGCGCEHDHEHEHHSHGECGCGCEHDHEYEHHSHDECGCGCEHDHEHEHHLRELAPAAGMVEKTYILHNLDCANCAAKMEAKLQRMPEIGDATIIFPTKQLRVMAENPDALLDEMQAVCQSIESEVVIETKSSATKAAAKTSDKGFFKTYKGDLIPLIIGAVIFGGGLLLEHLVFTDNYIVTLPIFAIGYLILGFGVLKEAGENILRGQVFDENFLMSIATLAAFCMGDFAEGMGVMLFYRIGELFEHIAVERSRSQIMDAVDMRPETVNLVDGDGFRVIPAEEAKVGDVILVRPGDRIPLDSVVSSGESRIDTSPVTGEPVPVAAGPGTELISGCVNEHGLLKVEVIKPLEESMVTRILDSVENAAANKPQIDRFITRFARVYTPIVVGLAVAIAIIPSLVSGDWNYWLTTAITFLVISCPCALVISVPLAFFAGIGAGSKIGVLFKGGASLEALKKVKAIVMDKTGTITEGNFKVQSIETFGILDETQVLSLVGLCEANSTHPIAKSIMDEIANRRLAIEEKMPEIEEIEELSGRGVSAIIEGRTVLCGNSKLMAERNIDMSDAALDEAGTIVLVAMDGALVGCINIADTVKGDAISAIDKIKKAGLIPAMLTGDARNSAIAIAGKCGIEKVFAQLMPADKLDKLQALREECGPVMFVGDGINDAPVLAGADVGAAMGSGADAAIEAADVVFMNSSVEAIPQSIDIAKATSVIAWQNVILALAIKLLVMVLGVLGFANIWAAVFADTGVAMICILNSLRILWKKF